MMELLKRSLRVPRMRRSFFSSATAPQNKFFMPSLQAAASSLAVQVSAVTVQAKDAIDGVIAARRAIRVAASS